MSTVLAPAWLACCAPNRFTSPARLAGHLVTEHHVAKERAVEDARTAFARMRPRRAPETPRLVAAPKPVERPVIVLPRRRGAIGPGRFAEAVTEAKRRVILEALTENDGIRVRAAAWLGITRSHLFHLIDELQIDTSSVKGSA